MRTYLFIAGGLALIAAAVTLVVLFSSKDFPPDQITEESEGTEIESGPQNATYVIRGEQIKLTEGVYEAESAPGSASRVQVRYFGNDLTIDLNNDGRDDKVFLLTEETGGTGTFYYVAAALLTDDGYVGSEAMLIGDRIAPQTTERGKNGMVIVNYADRVPGESFTATPSVGKTLVLKFDPVEMQFGEVVQDFEGEAEPLRMSLTMKTWEWISAINKDGQTIIPAKPGAFTLTFNEKGSVSVGTDCNSMGGSYTAGSAGVLTFDSFMSTLMYCEDSEEGVFAELLQDVGAYEFTSKGELVLRLKGGVGEIRLR